MSNYKYIKSVLILSLIAFGWGCQKKLDEDVRSGLTPDFFKTSQGLTAGLTAAYSGNRNLYGPETGLLTYTVVGTDEYRVANGTRIQAVGNYSSDFNSSNEFSSNIWNTCYTYINTCNGIVDYGSNVTDLSKPKVDQMVAEAKFLRANYYFILVQLFGSVTLNTHFQNTPSTTAEKAPLADLYSFIVQDLNESIPTLAASPQATGLDKGRATAAAARMLLSKVLLTRAWSPASKTTDADSALKVADNLINDAPALGIGLLPDFADVNKPLNETNKEVLFTIQYSADQTYGGSGYNEMNHYFVTRYELNIPGLPQRDMVNGRPFAWIAGTSWLYNTAFADKANDLRYNKSFQKVWYADVAASVTKNGQTYQINVGDTALFMPGYDVSDAVIASKSYVLIPPRKYNNYYFPTMTKYLDPNRTISVNQNSTRPLIVYRFAEAYLIAAEAAFLKGDPINAAKYINVLRTRAAYPSGDATLIQVSPSAVTLDYILDERTREFCGEQMRWFDLRRTRTLIDRVNKYDDYQAYLNIQAKDTLRPIPQSQIDAVITGDKYAQNPGW
ncbi:RagB/SusD family nutrient uptake outer membrane protein [Sphingobacterium siyangense]|uniref:RagB/SusD family nutrient uptake outer membrane protein n=1 Tax=Sphingobacterium siyangense TaxID=459529 RepID=UPI002FDD35AB